MKLSPGNSNNETRRGLGYKDGDDAAHLATDSRDGARSRLRFDYAFLDFFLQRCFQGFRLKMMSLGVFVSLACWLLWLRTTHASPASMPRTNNHGAPMVTVKNGTYSGVYSPSYKQDFFLGMPYAQKAERFVVAKELNSSWTDVKTATAYPPHCIGYGGDDIGYAISEDCLYLNVIRPAGLESTAGLPVAVWIHGGGLFMGGSADKRYNLSFIVENSVKLGTPMVAVSLNYRLSAFGFMMGKEAMSVGSTNIGFRDQRLALHWVHENIAAFGGDPAKVTIWGESSGAESVSAQILAYNGRDDKLFRGVIGESGFGSILHRYPGGFNATDLMQQTYDNLVRNTSCASTVGTQGSFDCLKKVSLDELNKAINVTGVGPWAPVMDNDFIAGFASNQLAEGKFPKVPAMMGCNTEEGTAFGSGRGPNGGGVQTDADMRAAIMAIIGAQAPSNTGKSADELTDELMYLYPNIQSIGIPSLETWPHVLVKGDNYSAQVGLQYRRTGALFGDYAMQYARRMASLAWSQAGIPSFAYRFNVLVNPLPESVGATHFQEVSFVFNNINGLGYAANPFGGSGSYPEKAKKLSKAMSYAWVNFITSQNPNGGGKPVLGVEWPVYNASLGGGSGQDIVFDIDEIHVEMDDWRAEGMNWMKENSLAVFGT